MAEGLQEGWIDDRRREACGREEREKASKRTLYVKQRALHRTFFIGDFTLWCVRWKSNKVSYCTYLFSSATTLLYTHLCEGEDLPEAIVFPLLLINVSTLSGMRPLEMR